MRNFRTFVAVSVVAGFTSLSPAQALVDFTVDETAFLTTSGPSTFTADEIQGSSFARVLQTIDDGDFTTPDPFTETILFRANSWLNDGSAVSIVNGGVTPDLNTTYQVYVIGTLSGTAFLDTAADPDSIVATFTSASLELWLDPFDGVAGDITAFDTTTGDATFATRTANFADDILLGTISLDTSAVNQATINLTGDNEGSFALTGLTALNASGTSFLVAGPSTPLVKINISGDIDLGILVDPNGGALFDDDFEFLVNSTGSPTDVDFDVPEPGTLSLLGSGLILLGIALTRRRYFN